VNETRISLDDLRDFRDTRNVRASFTYFKVAFGMFLAIMANVSDVLVRNYFRRQHVTIVESSADVNRASVAIAAASDRGFRQRLTSNAIYPPVSCNDKTG
jgi:hypothetical protein